MGGAIRAISTSQRVSAETSMIPLLSIWVNFFHCSGIYGIAFYSVTSRKVEESMVLAPPAEQTLFANRHRCDLVVYYDQSSTVLPTSYSDPLRNLKVAIYENEFSKSLQRVPVMLQGGFDAWVKLVGDRGVYVFQPAKDTAPSGSDNQENVPPINPVLSPHGMHPWMKNVVGRTDDDQMYQQPTNVNRTVMDYVSKNKALEMTALA
jgi:ubiquitin carboxyl-terminal hydrolase 8